MSVLMQAEARALHPPAAARACRPRLVHCPECAIRLVSVCSVLDRRELAAFENIGQQVTFAPRSVLFMEGVRTNSVYNVIGGLARLYRLLPNGHRQIVGFAIPGDFLGLPPDERYRYSADAAVATTVCRFPRSSFRAFAETHGHLFRRLHEAAARALDLAHDQMVQLGPRRADTKIAAFLLGMRMRWARIDGNGSGLVPLPMGRQDIGDYLGLSIATVSRTIHRLARRGLILIVGRGVRILDLPRIENLAAG